MTRRELFTALVASSAVGRVSSVAVPAESPCVMKVVLDLDEASVERAIERIMNELPRRVAAENEDSSELGSVKHE